MFEFIKTIFIIGLQAAGVVMLLTLFAIFVGWMERKLIAPDAFAVWADPNGKIRTIADFCRYD